MTTHRRRSTPPSANMRRLPVALLLASGAAAALAGAGFSPDPARAQGGVGAGAGANGTAVYWMTADTAAGMGAMGMGGAQGANPGAMARMMMGGGGPPSYARTLQLQLGSSRKAAGEPAAEHLPPAGLGAGASLPLVTPKSAPSGPPTPYDWTHMEKPKGRMLIYWGCGEHARPGQPAVIDFASLAAGKVPPAFAAINFASPPSAGAHTTYGEWPNARSQAQVPPSGSLVGAHVVRGNYTPEMTFSIAAANDYLAPIRIAGNEANGAGAVPLSWQPVPGAKGWLVSTTGAAENGDLVMWSSSESQAMAMAMAHLTDGEIDRLVRSKVLLPASATSCTVPAEVASAGQGAMLMTTAFGGDANYAEPKPVGAPKTWKPAWTVKLLTNSNYTGMLGMDMSEMFGGGDAAVAGPAPRAQPQSQPKKKRKGLGLPGGLGGLIGD